MNLRLTHKPGFWGNTVWDPRSLLLLTCLRHLTVWIRLFWLTQQGAGVNYFEYICLSEFICVPQTSFGLFHVLCLSAPIYLTLIRADLISQHGGCSLSSPTPHDEAISRRLLHSKGTLGWIMTSGVLHNTLVHPRGHRAHLCLDWPSAHPHPKFFFTPQHMDILKRPPTVLVIKDESLTALGVRKNCASAMRKTWESEGRK